MAISKTAYETLIYTIQSKYSEIQTSTLVLKPISKWLHFLEGEVLFANAINLVVDETIDFSKECILAYSYEIYQGSEKLYWYDSHLHPTDQLLASTHPYHKHIPPQIKHHRIPAPNLSFDSPNLPVLIEEIIEQLLQI